MGSPCQGLPTLSVKEFLLMPKGQLSSFLAVKEPFVCNSSICTPVPEHGGCWVPSSFQAAFPREYDSLHGGKRVLCGALWDTAGTGNSAGEATGWSHQVSKQQFPGGIAITSLQTEMFPFQSKHVGCCFCQKISYWRRETKGSIFSLNISNIPFLSL